MYYDKEKLENLITDSPLFTIDREESPTLYEREKYRLLENLYCYLMATNEKKYEPYGCEILKVSEDCIKAYDTTKGVFLHYFNVAWKKEYSHICGREIIEERLPGMMKISAEEKRLIVGLIRYRDKAKKENSYLSESEILNNYSDITGIPIEKVRYIAEIESSRVINSQFSDDDGERHDIIEQIPDSDMVEDSLLEANNISEIISKIEKAFANLQERQKPIISDLITAKLCPVIREILCDNTPIFISRRVYEHYSKTGCILSQKEIGEYYNKAEASVSRTYKEFLTKIQR